MQLMERESGGKLCDQITSEMFTYLSTTPCLVHTLHTTDRVHPLIVNLIAIVLVAERKTREMLFAEIAMTV